MGNSVNVRSGFLIDRYLRDSPAITQVPKDQAAVFAPTMNPPGQRNLLARMFGT